MIKQGTILKNKDGSEHKVLEVIGDLYFFGYQNKKNIGQYFANLQGLKDSGFIIPEEKWEPKLNEKYWYISNEAKKSLSTWVDDFIDHGRRDFLGVYPTGEALEQALAIIKEKIK